MPYTKNHHLRIAPTSSMCRVINISCTIHFYSLNRKTPHRHKGLSLKWKKISIDGRAGYELKCDFPCHIKDTLWHTKYALQHYFKTKRRKNRVVCISLFYKCTCLPIPNDECMPNHLKTFSMSEVQFNLYSVYTHTLGLMWRRCIDSLSLRAMSNWLAIFSNFIAGRCVIANINFESIIPDFGIKHELWTCGSIMYKAFLNLACCSYQKIVRLSNLDYGNARDKSLVMLWNIF